MNDQPHVVAMSVTHGPSGSTLRRTVTVDSNMGDWAVLEELQNALRDAALGIFEEWKAWRAVADAS